VEQKVKIVAVTKGVGDLAERDAQEVISFAARVSSPKNQKNFDTSQKLLKYCIKNSHWSVFEHASMTLEIKTSRAITAQILRHRSFTFQEFSQRYAEAVEFIKYPARRQDTKNRQNSIDDMEDKDKLWFEVAQDRIWWEAKKLYDEALAKGIAKEQARFLLPLSTETTIYMTGNVRSWIQYINLRSANGTQLEHMKIAEECKKIFTEYFPDIAKALEWTS
jgi:thymidylate synthase (FAD)